MSARVYDDDFDEQYNPDDEYGECHWCGGDGWHECRDEIQCTYEHNAFGECRCSLCGGSGRAVSARATTARAALRERDAVPCVRTSPPRATPDRVPGAVMSALLLAALGGPGLPLTPLTPPRMCRYGTDILVNVKIPADLSSTGEEKWRAFGIDACIAPIVDALQKGGIDMRASCCGHGKGHGRIELADGRVLRVEQADAYDQLTTPPRALRPMTIDNVLYELDDAMHACCDQPLSVDEMTLTRTWRAILERFVATRPVPE